MIASEIMTENPRTIRQTASVRDAIDVLQELSIRHLPVVDESDTLVGMLSDRDLGALMKSLADVGAESNDVIVPLARRKVSELMSADPISVEEDTDVSSIIETMLEERIGAVPVLDGDGIVTGIISYVDILRALAPAAAE